MQHLTQIIETAFEDRAKITAATVTQEVSDAVAKTLELLDKGELRVAQPTESGWHVNQWAKKAVLLSFRILENKMVEAGHTNYFDKVPLKYANTSQDEFEQMGTRVVPQAIVRTGCYVAPNVVLMPSYTNIGAYIDEGAMIDTWATVGSCAQIGKNVHLSGGVGIGGVLEPLQANPTIIEDNCFIGARSEIVEGVIVEKGSVISMGVFIGQSTKIYNRATGEITYGRVPAGSVVVAGSLPSKDGSHSLGCAIIVKQVDEKTRSKTSVNELLRMD